MIVDYSDPDVKKVIETSYQPYFSSQIQQDMTHWPFEVIDNDGSPLIKVNYLNEDKTFTPQEISAMVLAKMKEISEAKLGKTVAKAVVTCDIILYFLDRVLIYNLPAFQLISTTHNVWQQKMLELLLDSRFSVSSMSPLLPLLLTVSTDKLKPRGTS